MDRRFPSSFQIYLYQMIVEAVGASAFERSNHQRETYKDDSNDRKQYNGTSLS